MIVPPRVSLQGEHPYSHHPGQETEFDQPPQILPSFLQRLPLLDHVLSGVENISGYERAKHCILRLLYNFYVNVSMNISVLGHNLSLQVTMKKYDRDWHREHLVY